MPPLDPDRYFIAPDGRNRDTVAQWLHMACARLLDVTAGDDDRPVRDLSPLDVPAIPVMGRPFAEILAEAARLTRATSRTNSPRYAGHMDTIPAVASIVGDLFAAAINNNLLSQEMSSQLSHLEGRVTDELARRMGFGDGSGGVMTAGGSLANLLAVTAARQRFLTRHGSPSLTEAVLYTSQDAHVSVRKAAKLLGLRSDQVVQLPVDSGGRMRFEALADRLRLEAQAGRRPLAVVATAGTTVMGGIDPLSDVARLCRDHETWLHVDAAYGGALQFSSTHAGLLEGIAEADSITFNPQKWCYVAKTCALLLVRDLSTLTEAARLPLTYMSGTGPLHRGELTIEGTRHADVLKLHLTLQHLGEQGLGELVDRGIAQAREFAAACQTLRHWKLVAEPHTNIVCLRRLPPEGTPGPSLAAHNASVLAARDRLLRHANLFLSAPLYHEERILRGVFLNPYLTPAHWHTMLDVLDAEA